LNKRDLENIASEIEREESLFAHKEYLDALKSAPAIIGREDKARELARFLLSSRKGHVVPFISVYGRAGSGKSTLVKFVCENLPDISYRFVNLRRAKTVFGCANLILAEFGVPNLKSAQGINVAIEKIGEAIESALGADKKRLFVLALDEFDVLFYDKRGRPSDFIYKLLVMQEKQREKGRLVCIIAISNNVVVDQDVDDRVRSRMGSSEVFFGAYSKKDVLEILQDRAKSAFALPADPEVLEYCAEMSSSEHGDARRAIDLLRVAAEIAGKKGEKKLAKTHVDGASEQLQKERINTVLSGASLHLKLVCSAVARITFLTGEDWHSTSSLYDQYVLMVSRHAKGVKPLMYRRVSELLTELENTGLVTSQTGSRGRRGYGSQYKLTAPPEAIGSACFADWWKSVVKKKKEHDEIEKSGAGLKLPTKSPYSGLSQQLESMYKDEWDTYVGNT